jgi:hypothetical protein
MAQVTRATARALGRPETASSRDGDRRIAEHLCGPEVRGPAVAVAPYGTLLPNIPAAADLRDRLATAGPKVRTRLVTIAVQMPVTISRRAR